MNEPISVQIDAISPQGKGVKRLTLGVRQSKL